MRLGWGGDLGQEFSVGNGVRQGCIVVALLFNVFLDFVVKQALASMPPDSKVSVQFQADSNLLFSASPKASLKLAQITLLLYADDMVFFSADPDNLVLMLKCMDVAAKQFALRVNAAKTKVMSVGKGESRLLAVVAISGGPIEKVDSFKYLGGILTSNNSLTAEVNARRGRGLGAFAQFSVVWRNKHLGLGAKVQVFNTFVVSHFVYGAETWNVMQSQQKRLESTYNNCLKGIMGVRVSDRHSLQHIWKTCQVKPLASLLAQRWLRWLGHVARMPEARYPHVALIAQLTGVTFGRGSLSCQPSTKTSRQLAYHTRVGSDMCRQGKITLAPVGAGHVVYTSDPHTGTHTTDPSM
jgi:hypothetical protein